MPLIDFKEDKKEILPKAVSDSKLPLLSTIIPPSQQQVYSQKKNKFLNYLHFQQLKRPRDQ